MQQDIQRQAENALFKVQSALRPGQLGERRDTMLSVLESGDTAFFAGEVHWRILLTEHDKALTGESESMHAAFADMSRCLGALALDHGNAAAVACAIEATPEHKAS